ncbi:MqnA/MqnD/SBP family protein [Desulfoplanes sp.]
MNKRSLTIALSPCPNDTFIFGAWVLGRVPDMMVQGSRFFWKDVQRLNEDAGKGCFDVVKVSAVQALRLEPTYTMLRCGGAFGTEQGPKLVTLPGTERPRRIAVPGMLTTATTLLRAAYGTDFEPVPMPFDRQIESLKQQHVDAALLIHETALVYQAHGLDLLLDLGKWWNGITQGLPLPLGTIILRRDIANQFKDTIEEQIRRSLQSALKDPRSLVPVMRGFAQEMDPATLEVHIQAYVNTYSMDISTAGQAGLDHLRSLLPA